MGQFTIVIHGTGAHHNWETAELEGPTGKGDYIVGRKNDFDADLLFAEFVEHLKAKGHTITGATFTVGGMYGSEAIIPRDYVNPHIKRSEPA